MKTITQLRAELRAAAEHIEALSQDLAQLQPSEQKRGVDFAHIQTIGERYPIRDHCLTGENADFQRQYLTLLTAPLLLESQEPENGWLFLQRILSGIDCTTPLVDLQADAASLTEQHLDTFSAAVLKRELANALMLDGMLLYLSCRGGEAMQDWLAGLAELLGRTLFQVQELSELASLIVTENKEGLQSLMQSVLSVDLTHIRCHIFLVLGYYFRFNGQTLLYYGDGRTPLAQSKDFPQISTMKVSRIEIRNAVFEGEPVCFSINNCDLLLEDCIVRNIHTSSAMSCFKYCSVDSAVLFRRCHFENLVSDSRTIEIVHCQSLTLECVSFYNIRSTGRDCSTLSFSRCQMRTVTLDNIQGKSRWYSGFGGGTATTDCYYRNCTGGVSGLPEGLKEKKEG